jgi:hypothetical protein
VRGFACAVSVAALLSAAGPAAAAHAGTAGPCDAKLLAYFKADDAVQTAQADVAAAQQALEGADNAAKILQNADASIREAVLALPWAKAPIRAQLNLGKSVRAYKSLYINAMYNNAAASGGDPGVAAQNLAVAAHELVDDAKSGSDQGTMFVMRRVSQGASDIKAAYPLFLTIPARKADLAQAMLQADKVQSGVSMARGALEACLQNATGKS